MKQEWNPTYDELLEQLLCGTRKESDPMVEQALHDSEEFRRRWLNLQEIQRRMESSSRARASILEQARTSSKVPEEDAALSAFRQQIQAEVKPLRHALWPRFAAAAALLLVAGSLYFLFSPGGREVDPGGILGPESGIELLAPEGPAKLPLHIAWSPASDPRVFRYELCLWDLTHGNEPRELERATTRSTYYDARTSMPGKILLTIQPLDANGRPVGAALSAEIEVAH